MLEENFSVIFLKYREGQIALQDHGCCGRGKSPALNKPSGILNHLLNRRRLRIAEETWPFDLTL